MAISKREVGALAIGFGTGIAIGYYVPNAISKPTISVVGTTWTYSGFPPNVPLMSMGGGTGGIGSAPLSIGSTDANGVLVITGAPQVPAGNTILYAVFVATDPTIFTTVILKT